MFVFIEKYKKKVYNLVNKFGGNFMAFFDKAFGYENENKAEVKGLNDAVCSGLRIIRPVSFEGEVNNIADLIREGNIVAFNLENLNSESGQRMIDFLSGATYVLGGKIEKITDKVYASVPSGIPVESIEVE